MAQIEFNLTEEGRAVAVVTTLEDDTLPAYIGAFVSALRAFGFTEDTIAKHLPPAAE